MIISRREYLASQAALILLGFTPAILTAASAEPFSCENLIKRARALSKQAYQPNNACAAVEGIDDDIANQIHYRADKQLFDHPHGDTSERLFSLSRSAQTPVNVFVVSDGRATLVPYDPATFRHPNSRCRRAFEAKRRLLRLPCQRRLVLSPRNSGA